MLKSVSMTLVCLLSFSALEAHHDDHRRHEPSHRIACHEDRDRVALDFFGEEIRGHNRLDLRRLIENNCQHIRTHHLELDEVILEARSLYHRGEALLEVNRERTRPELIDSGFRHRDRQGRNRDPWRNRWPSREYDRVYFENPSNNSHGEWDLFLRGDIKIHGIEIYFKPHHRHDDRGRHHDSH